MQNPADTLADAVDGVDDGLLLVVTGAGISLASGIPTFRGSDKGAVWKRDVVERGTVQYFLENPVGSWHWYVSRFSKVLTAEPNPAHHALVALERWQLARGGRYLLVTQNVDALHRKAGAKELVEVHGSADRVRCPVEGCRYGAPRGSLPRPPMDVDAFVAAPSLDQLPRCPQCGAVLRQHVLWFDEFYHGHEDYQWDRVQAAARAMDLLLFVGTSFSVGVTELFAQHGLLGRMPIFSIDPGGARPPYPGIRMMQQRAEDLLPTVCDRLGAA